VSSLQLSDLDFARSSVRVLRKGHREKVALELPPEVSRELAEWVAARGPHEGALFHDTRVNRPGHRGPLSGETIRRVVAATARAAKLDGVRPHGLRHSFATIALRRGETIQDVMIDMGHLRPETTMKYHDAIKNRGGSVRKKAAKLLG
jgi:integrase/recombinase XerD